VEPGPEKSGPITLLTPTVRVGYSNHISKEQPAREGPKIMSDRLQLTNKIHTAAETGTVGNLRDRNGRWARTTCGTRNAKTRPHYVDADAPVTCIKCLAD